MIDTQRLIAKCAALGIELSPEKAAQLDEYAEILVEYNQKVNLTAVTDPEGIEDRHFVDSLLFANGDFWPANADYADVGTGAGFPGVVVKIFRPDVRLTLMEPTGKRIDFLKYLCGRLGLQADFVKERAEEAARKQWRERFDVVSARAVAALPVLCEYCLPLAQKGGLMVALKGPGAAEETAAAKGAAAKLGGTLENTAAFTLPAGDTRVLVSYRKTGTTPPAYPRNGGKIAKAPLK